jgi:hypothetical protein
VLLAVIVLPRCSKFLMGRPQAISRSPQGWPVLRISLDCRDIQPAEARQRGHDTGRSLTKYMTSVRTLKTAGTEVIVNVDPCVFGERKSDR